MKDWFLLGASLAALSTATPAFAQNDWFVEGSVAGGWLDGGSDTTNGGAAFGGGGTVRDIDVDSNALFSVGVGRSISQHWSLGVNYERLDSEVSFVADYVLAPGFPSYFDGDASSDALLLNIRYTSPIGGEQSPWSIGGAVGLGIARNTLENVTEDFAPPDNVADQQIADGEDDQFAWRVSGRLSRTLTTNISVFGEVSYFDFGEFTTGNSRSAPTEAIGPYQVDISGVNLGAGLRFTF